MEGCAPHLVSSFFLVRAFVLWWSMKSKTKGKNKRVERVLKKKEPKVVENVKNAMFLKGPSSSELITQVLKNLVGFVFFL
jgi:hypothetical protein